MKKESILSPQEKLVKKRKIEENRQKKQQMLQAASANSGNKRFYIQEILQLKAILLMMQELTVRLPWFRSPIPYWGLVLQQSNALPENSAQEDTFA